MLRRLELRISALKGPRVSQFHYSTILTAAVKVQQLDCTSRFVNTALGVPHVAASYLLHIRAWPRREDSNLQLQHPKCCRLPLTYFSIYFLLYIYYILKLKKNQILVGRAEIESTRHEFSVHCSTC